MNSLLFISLKHCSIRHCVRNGARCISTTSARLKEDEEPSKEKEGWFSKLLGIQTIEPMKASHSSMLSDKDVVYELSTHNIKAGEMDSYSNHYEQFANAVTRKVPDTTLFGSWKVFIGNQDQSVHLWRYSGGYGTMDETVDALLTDEELLKLSDEQSKLCRKRKSVVVLPFSFWGEPKPRDPKHIYELRSYVLKPGTMIEWGNNWARGINFRRDFNQDVGGFFSQIGRLYMVFHFWAYKDLMARKQIREETWRKPGWDTNVAYTVPLIKKMESKIMVPHSYSKLQ